VIEAERTSNSYSPVARAKILACSEMCGRQRLGINFNHRQIGETIAANYFAFELAFVIQSHFNVVSLPDHMVVRQNVTIRSKNDARAAAARLKFSHFGLTRCHVAAAEEERKAAHA